jgi:hypothetical protein
LDHFLDHFLDPKSWCRHTLPRAGPEPLGPPRTPPGRTLLPKLKNLRFRRPRKAHLDPLPGKPSKSPTRNLSNYLVRSVLATRVASSATRHIGVGLQPLTTRSQRLTAPIPAMIERRCASNDQDDFAAIKIVGSAASESSRTDSIILCRCAGPNILEGIRVALRNSEPLR